MNHTQRAMLLSAATPRRCRHTILAAIAVLSAPAIAPGGSCCWTNPAGGSFGLAANWDAGVPGDADQATFALNSEFTVLFGDSYVNNRALVDGGSVTFNLGAGTYTLLHESDGTGAALHIADSAKARLTVINGSVQAKDTLIGRYGNIAGEGGELVVGAGARWTAFQHGIATGDRGDGTLIVQAGGIVEHGHGWAGGNPGATGSVLVTGPGSDLLVTGWYGLGTSDRGDLTVEQQGVARMGVCEMATNPGSEAHAIVDGNGSVWQLLSANEVSLQVGKSSTATVDVSNGGVVHSYGHAHMGSADGVVATLSLDGADSGMTIDKTLVVGVAGGAQAVVDVSGGAQLVILGRGSGDVNDAVGMEIGREGVGMLQIRTGGHARNDYITSIGAWTGGRGEVIVNGDGSWLENLYRMEVGRDGIGNLSIENGGRVTVSRDNTDPTLSSGGMAQIGLRAAGEVLVTGVGTQPSMLETEAQLQVGAGSVGTLTIADGGLVVSHKATSATLSSGLVGISGGEGAVVVQEPGSLWTQDGGLSVGFSAIGTMRVEAGGAVESVDGYVARLTGSSGTATIGNGVGVSRWDMTGSLYIAGDSTNPAADSMGTLVINSDGRVVAPVSTRVWHHGQVFYNGGTFSTGTLELVGGGNVILAEGADKTVLTTALAIDAANGSRLDLADNKLIIDYTGVSPIDSVRVLLQSGSAGGWTGNGITSVSAAADPTKGLGYGEASVLGMTSFGGYDVDPTSILIKYTWEGDANLDGQVDISDLARLATNWQTANVWTGGDFDYSGFVDITDLAALATNWQAGVGAPLSMSFEQALASVGLAGVAVPEPAVAMVFTTIIAGGRRRTSRF